jgi:hypothetical protein
MSATANEYEDFLYEGMGWILIPNIDLTLEIFWQSFQNTLILLGFVTACF